LRQCRPICDPYIYRTRDGGKTWQKITDGLPVNAIARTVREDPKRKGLLYGGTETGVYVSFDYGDHWQPLQLNLPTTSVRDLNVHGSDLVAATYGRGLWILDDISPLRQVDDLRGTTLLKPANAVRARWDNHPDTPLSIDLAHSDNPPDGTNHLLLSEDCRRKAFRWRFATITATSSESFRTKPSRAIHARKTFLNTGSQRRQRWQPNWIESLCLGFTMAAP
jgi:hypothetical protein